MNPLWLILIIPLSMIAGVVILVLWAIHDESDVFKKCRGCPSFHSECFAIAEKGECPLTKKRHSEYNPFVYGERPI